MTSKWNTSESATYYFHEKLGTHGRVLNRIADIEPGDTMIYTIKNGNDCLPMPASARSALLPLYCK
jgi:hypothetical protein